LLAIAIFAAACVRAGFDTGEGAAPGDGTTARRDQAVGRDGVDGNGVADGQAPRFDARTPPDRQIVDAPTASIHVTGNSDTCSSPRSISLSSTPGAVEIDTTGAGDDFSFTGCAGLPDVVLRASGSSTLRVHGCWGGGSFAFEAHNTCENPSSVQGGTGACIGAGGFNYHFGFDPFYIVICRDPAEGPATLLLGGE